MSINISQIEERVRISNALARSRIENFKEENPSVIDARPRIENVPKDFYCSDCKSNKGMTLIRITGTEEYTHVRKDGEIIIRIREYTTNPIMAYCRECNKYFFEEENILKLCKKKT